MKKLMSLVLALAMILSLAACGGKTTGTSPDSAGDSQQETPATSDGAFPEKQITIIMPWSLGGGPDTIARQVASYGEKYWRSTSADSHGQCWWNGWYDGSSFPLWRKCICCRRWYANFIRYRAELGFGQLFGNK